jgi:solute carrier family 25 carnitine/acylcarnitine transporter 20/29
MRKVHSHLHKVIYSAPYSGVDSRKASHGTFHKFNLDRASEILQVYFLVQNLDRWTVGRFRERIDEGIGKLVRNPQLGYQPWRRFGDILASSKSTEKENIPQNPKLKKGAQN